MRRMMAAIAVLLLFKTTAYAQAPEYQVKAAMLANFALFIEWPPVASSTAQSPFVVCVVGKDPFGPWLKQEMGDRVGGHPVVVRNVTEAEAATGCSMVFIGQSEEPRLKEILGVVGSTGALTISDVKKTDDFCRAGGMIALTMKGNKVRFALNADAAAKTGLKINSKLKRIASTNDCGK